MTFIRTLAVLLTTAFVFTTTPANAQQVVGHDPKGDAAFYDIARVTVKHREEKVRFAIHAYDRTPYGYHVFIDKPGGKPWEYVVMWAAYTPRKISVRTPKQFRTLKGAVCRVRSGKEPTTRDVEFNAPTSCFKDPNKLRVRTKGWDDEVGYTDQTAWTRWANRA